MKTNQEIIPKGSVAPEVLEARKVLITEMLAQVKECLSEPPAREAKVGSIDRMLATLRFAMTTVESDPEIANKEREIRKLRKEIKDWERIRAESLKSEA